MSTIDKEPEFLAAVIPDSTQTPKRRAVRIFHRGRLHRDQAIDTQTLHDAEASLTPDEKRKALLVHATIGSHELGTDPGPRQHTDHGPRNPWKRHH